MSLRFTDATAAEIPALVALRAAVADLLGRSFGPGPWAHVASERGVRAGFRHARIVAAWSGDLMVGTLRLTARKPWAIDLRYFDDAARPLYLTDMAVHPVWQRRGVGRRCLEHARSLARDWPADALRLDAYDAPAGAGAFYRRCGFRDIGRASYRGTPLLYFEDRPIG